MLATGVSAPCAKVQSHRRRHAPCHRLPVASNTNQLCPRFSSAIVDEPRRRRRTEAAGLPFFGGLGTLAKHVMKAVQNSLSVPLPTQPCIT